MANNIAFRRIRGHIVPIKIGNKTHQVNVTAKTAQGVAEAAAGAGVAAYAGNRAYQFLRKAADVQNLAKIRQSPNALGQMSLFKARGAQKLFKLSNKLSAARNIALLAGGVLGGALIAKGVHDIVKDNGSLKKSPQVQKTASLSGGFGLASLIAGAAYYKKIDPTKTFKQVIELAKKRKTIQYMLKGV